MSVPAEFQKNAEPELSEHLLSQSFGASSAEPDIEQQQVYLDEDVLPQGATVGEKQPPQYRDAGFAVAFLIQLMMVLVLAFYWGLPALSTSSSSTSSSSSGGKLPYKSGDTTQFLSLFHIFLLSGLAAVAMSALGLFIMARYAKRLIQISALLHLVVSMVMVVVFCFQLAFVAALFTLVFVLLGAWYFWSIQNRIHFAASNLVTASEAIRSNLGVILVAYTMVFVAFVWSTLWVVAFNGARLKTSHCDEYSADKECITSHSSKVVMLLLLLSFYWTHQVILNIVHVTVAGVVSTFWFAPEEASSFCSPSIWDSWSRASTFSLGSVALGSLLVSIFQCLQYLIQQWRRNGGDGILACVADLFVTILEDIVEYFNKWAFVYVGVYGYSYLESGHKVMSLFRQRGWTTLVNDQLTYNVLNMMVVAIGLSAAGVMLAAVTIMPSLVAGLKDNSGYIWVVVLIPLTIGILMASVMMRVVSSAVDTVIVCFAEAPNDFRRHHPHLHQNMVEAWRLTYPNEFGF